MTEDYFGVVVMKREEAKEAFYAKFRIRERGWKSLVSTSIF